MAELASGAVRTLLGVLRDEKRRLDRVEGDLKFIQEEMESMNSFLQHLDRTTPPGDHEEQVRTWMKQVRDLAYACSNCIDLYLLRSDRAAYRFTGPKLYAQHRAAIQLRELKDRARDVGKRRLRYDVKILEKSGGKPSEPEATSSSSQTAGGGDAGDDERRPEVEAMRALAFAEPRILEECTQELVNWLSHTEKITCWWFNKDRFPSIAIAAPDKEHGADVAREALADPSVETKFELKLWITFPWFLPASPYYILREILGELLPESQEGEWAKILELDRKIEEIVEKTKEHLQAAGTKPVKEATDKLDDDQIAKNIKELQELLSKRQEDKPAVKEGKDKLDEDHIEEKIKETTEHIIDNLLRRKLLPKPKEDMDKLDEDQMPYEKIEEIVQNIRGTLRNITDHLLVQEITKKIKERLEDKRTIVVLDGINYAYKWGETKRALNQLGCATGSAVIVTTSFTQGSEELCNPIRQSDITQGSEELCNPTSQSAIIYSLVHFYYRKVLLFTSRRKNKDFNEYNLRKILLLCEPHESCMKLFVRVLYANPDKSKEELEKLLDTLDSRGSLDLLKKMLTFSYNDLPRDYKTCFLYLAIFPRGHKIRRSTLVGRWVVEGLITKEDWPSSVHRAERCFDQLVNRWLVYPGDTGAAGKVESCIVHDIVHEFIIEIARKEHFVETRLSHRWAHHFSVLSDVRLRSSDSIEKFLQNLYRMPLLPLVKVLDLEDCQCFEKNQHYIKNICSKMLLLKYLSLRKTDITQLPKEVNNLHQLEVLDIRQTPVDASATRSLMLLKLKRLLASCNIDTTRTRADHEININRTKKSFDAVKIPRGIGEMTNMEVLSHVEASEGGAHLKDIGNLWQLRKLGVVIHDKETHLEQLVQVMDDLNESLQSLSISIKSSQARSQVTLSNTGIKLKNSLKLLESLNIRGKTSGRLLTLLVKHCDQLAKVTLRNTLLNQDNVKDLGGLSKLRCVRLRHESYIERNLTFMKDEFEKLKYFLVEGPNMTEISFEDAAAPELEKIVFSSTNITSITFGNRAAPKLEEIALSSTTITSITFGNGGTPNLKKIVLSSTNITSITFGNGAAPKLEEIVLLSSTNITSITFENGATPNLKKIVLASFTNLECLSAINFLPVLKELELNDSRIASALLSLFTNANQLAKVTLRGTFLKQGGLQILAKQKNLRFLLLLDKSCDERQLTFNKEEFQNLKLLVVECFGITKISFAEGATPKLEKIVWSFTDIQSLSGIDNLPALKELKFKGKKIPNWVSEDIAKHPNCPVLRHTQQKNQDKEEEEQ